MIVYEKNNKLNINFENELDNPDIEIGKGEINVDGNNIVNGGGSGPQPLVVTYTDGTLDKTYSEIETAFLSGTNIIICRTDTGKSTKIGKYLVVCVNEIVDDENPYRVVVYTEGGANYYWCSAKSDYPEDVTIQG